MSSSDGVRDPILRTRRAPPRFAAGRTPGSPKSLRMLPTAIAMRCWRALPKWAKRTILWLSNAHFLVGAAAVIRDDQGRVLVARHTYRAGPPWGLLAGWVRGGEDPAVAIVREVREETALDIEVTRPLTVLLEGRAHLTVVYDARLTGGAFRPSAEVSAVRFLERGAWPDGLRDDHRALIETYVWDAPGALRGGL